MPMRKNEEDYASPILPNSFTGTLKCTFERHWKKNSDKAKEGGAQRAFFKTDKLGIKMLNVSAIYAEIIKSEPLSKVFILEKDGVKAINFSKPFHISLEKGRITGIKPVVEEAKETADMEW